MQKQETAGMPGLFYKINTSKTGSKTGLKASKTGRAFNSPAGFADVYQIRLPTARNNGAKTSEMTVISLIRMLMDGPEVSLNGSPTVSPTTAA